MNRRHQFTEDFALAMELQGLPRMAGRILGWLLICDPPDQSMPEIVDALGASKSSVSTMTRQLIHFGMVERFSRPGERHDRYRATPGYWLRQLEGATREFAAYRTIAEQGLALLEDAPAAARANLRDMRDVSIFLEREFPALLQRWEDERTQEPSGGGAPADNPQQDDDPEAS